MHLLPRVLIALTAFILPAYAQTSLDAVEHDQSTAPRDTIFVLDSTYIEVNVDAQELYHYFRSGRVDTHLCSTGNPDLPKGLATRPGIFSIQGKAKQHRSSRFDVMMYYWMPFDGGIGLHSLTGDGYYPFLGYEPSSHGCVRLSNESAEEIFRQAPVGTVVFVHGIAPARIVRFADTTRSDITVMKQIDRKLLRNRLDAVMAGRTDDPSLAQKLALPTGRKNFRMIEVGRIPDMKTSEK